MNWDEKAEDYAGVHHTYEHRSPEDNRLIKKGIVHGARWQRDQLRTNEAVERVARELYIRDFIDPEKGERRWANLGDGKRYHLQHARAAVDALLGEGA